MVMAEKEGRAERFYRNRLKKAMEESQPPLPGSEEFSRLIRIKEEMEAYIEKYGDPEIDMEDPHNKFIASLTMG